MAGALGTLGVITEISFKVLPRRRAEATLAFELDEADAIEQANRWAGQPLPLSATAWQEGMLRVRLSGRRDGGRGSAAKMGGEEVDAARLLARAARAPRWRSSRPASPLWRLSVPQTAEPIDAEHAAARSNGAAACAGSCGDARSSRPALDRRARGRPRHALPRRRQVGRRLPPAAARARQDPQAPQGTRSIRPASSTRDACTTSDRCRPSSPTGSRTRPRGIEADAILRKCVHCGFCLATCPTYNLLGDELDSPRGRIYLMKQMLEGAPVTERTQLHLDRCLTCRACETTCPSGVEYGRLVDIGRELVEQKVAAHAVGPAAALAVRAHAALARRSSARRSRSGAPARPLLPAALATPIPWRHAPGAWPGAAPRAPHAGARRAACSRRWRRRSTRPPRACSIALGISLVRVAGRRLLRRGHLPPQLPGRGARLREGATSTRGGRTWRRAPRRS